MGKKFNAFVTGALALVGIGLSGNAQASVARTPSEISSIQNVSEKAPLYLEKFAQTNSESDQNLLAWHTSHSSHSSHSSHVSHVSHQSGY